MEELIQNIHFTNIWWALVTPVFLMLLDVITGYYGAWKDDKVSSSKMRDGLGKKCAELVYIFIGILAKFAIEADFIMYFLIIYVCYMELVSLAENCDKLGFPLPPSWKKKLNNNDKEE